MAPVSDGPLYNTSLPEAVTTYLRETNPWWAGRPGRVVPTYRRWVFRTALEKLLGGLAPVLVLRGPRQVGKTTLQEQIVRHLIEEEGVEPRRVLRVQLDELPSLRRVKALDEPILALVRWYQDHILGQSLNEAAREGRTAFLFFDEAQNLKAWAPQLKALVDHHTVRVFVTGSSSLRIASGQDSLAGRVTTLDLGPLLLREIAALRYGETIEPAGGGVRVEDLCRQDFWHEVRAYGKKHRELRDRAFQAFSEVGGYPMAQARPDAPWPEVADQLNETVVRRAIKHDLRLGERGRTRDPQLLEAVFTLACRYAGQSPGQDVFVEELRGGLGAGIRWGSIRAYLQFLEQSMLVELVEPLELRLRKKGRSAYKLCLCDHALRASWLREKVSLEPFKLQQEPAQADLAGRLAESIVGYFLANFPHLAVNHLPAAGGRPEVDFVLTIGARRIPVEVKYRRRIDADEDTRGLRAFIEKTVHNAPFGVLVTMLDEVRVRDPRIEVVPLPSLLLMR